MDYSYDYPSPFGGVRLTSDGEAITGLRFDGGIGIPRTEHEAPAKTELPVFAAARRWLDEYSCGRAPEKTPPIRVTNATPFQRAVWDLLLEIPYGETATYGEIARRLEKRLGVRRMSAQAVGNAVGRNPVALMIPCHRVMGAHGNLTGYGYGADRKLLLLRLEGVATEGFYLPGLSAPELEKALRQAQIKRIAAYEDLMRETTALLQNAPNDARLREGMRALEIYYGSAVWKQDFADDEAGLPPSDLKRGVLSEDGLYDLMEEYGQLLREKQ